MNIYRTVADLPRSGQDIGFVPTMGAFHEGHLTLMRMAKEETGYCLVSLFVNPTQFGAGEDFDRYPRNEERDFELARSAGVDAIFAPSISEIYNDSLTTVSVSGVSEGWEGSVRPHHFNGVSTVVAKLFGILGPCRAYFGLKDYQQCRVIDQMVRDLFLPIELEFVETIREPDGLALSSRNVYLSAEERRLAPAIYASLLEARDSIRKGQDIVDVCRDTGNSLVNRGIDVQYFAAVDPSMQAIDRATPQGRLITAAKVGRTRLIDNVSLVA